EEEEVLGEHKDDLLSLGLWQELPEHWRFEGAYSHLEGDPRDWRIRAFYGDPESETTGGASYYQPPQTQSIRGPELDPFVSQLMEYFPYREANLDVSHAFGAHTVVDAGLDLRRVTHSGDVGEFNREWERYYATATLNDLPVERMSLSVTVDRW